MVYRHEVFETILFYAALGEVKAMRCRLRAVVAGSAVLAITRHRDVEVFSVTPAYRKILFRQLDIHRGPCGACWPA